MSRQLDPSSLSHLASPRAASTPRAMQVRHSHAGTYGAGARGGGLLGSSASLEGDLSSSASMHGKRSTNAPQRLTAAEASSSQQAGGAGGGGLNALVESSERAADSKRSSESMLPPTKCASDPTPSSSSAPQLQSAKSAPFVERSVKAAGSAATAPPSTSAEAGSGSGSGGGGGGGAAASAVGAPSAAAAAGPSAPLSGTLFKRSHLHGSYQPRHFELIHPGTDGAVEVELQYASKKGHGAPKVVAWSQVRAVARADDVGITITQLSGYQIFLRAADSAERERWMAGLPTPAPAPGAALGGLFGSSKSLRSTASGGHSPRKGKGDGFVRQSSSITRGALADIRGASPR